MMTSTALHQSAEIRPVTVIGETLPAAGSKGALCVVTEIRSVSFLGHDYSAQRGSIFQMWKMRL